MQIQEQSQSNKPNSLEVNNDQKESPQQLFKKYYQPSKIKCSKRIQENYISEQMQKHFQFNPKRKIESQMLQTNINQLLQQNQELNSQIPIIVKQSETFSQQQIQVIAKKTRASEYILKVSANQKPDSYANILLMTQKAVKLEKNVKQMQQRAKSAQYSTRKEKINDLFITSNEKSAQKIVNRKLIQSKPISQFSESQDLTSSQVNPQINLTKSIYLLNKSPSPKIIKRSKLKDYSEERQDSKFCSRDKLQKVKLDDKFDPKRYHLHSESKESINKFNILQPRTCPYTQNYQKLALSRRQEQYKQDISFQIFYQLMNTNKTETDELETSFNSNQNKSKSTKINNSSFQRYQITKYLDYVKNLNFQNQIKPQFPSDLIQL